jgi:hypothetical protein
VPANATLWLLLGRLPASTMSTVKDVAKRIEQEVGLSRTLSVRIANRLNELAKTVPWATPVEDAASRARLARQKTPTRKTNRSM